MIITWLNQAIIPLNINKWKARVITQHNCTKTAPLEYVKEELMMFQ